MTGADPGNYTRGGTGVIAPGSVADPTALTGDAYEIDFQVVPATGPGASPTTTYTVQDTTLGQPVPATPVPAVGIPYTSGQTIAFDGMTMAVTGAPADGDKFTVQPSQKQSIFTTMTNLINALHQANQNLSNAHDNILTVRASVGSRLNELDALDSAGGDLDTQYQSQLVSLTGLDEVAAISQFTQQQTTLDAAQKSFKTVSGLSLFNYIGS